MGSLRQRQGENQQSAALSVMNHSPAGYDIEPYANMALRRALVSGFQTPQIQAPDGIPMGKLSGGFDINALKPVMDQYFNDNAIKASMQQQESLRANVDPYGPRSTVGLQMSGDAFGPGYQPYFDATQGVADAAQNRLEFQNRNSEQALQDAIGANNRAARFNPVQAALNTILGGGKKLLTAGLL